MDGAYDPSLGATEQPPVPGKAPAGQVVIVGLAVAIGLATLSGLTAWPNLRQTTETQPAPTAVAPATTPAALAEGLSFSAADEPYRPPNPAEVELANAAARQEHRSGGLSALARYGLDCFRRLEQAPSYRMLDFCVAFDRFAEREGAAAGVDPASGDGWFGRMATRHRNAAQAIMGAEGDADARLADLRQMVAMSTAGEQDAPQPALSAATQAAPAAPSVAKPRPLEPARIQHPAARRTVAPAGPSFNCRYARSPSERTICRDSGLQAADRRLEQAFKAAIQAGVPEWELRGDQNRWLGDREMAASNPVMLAAVYAQRIGELEAIADRATP